MPNLISTAPGHRTKSENARAILVLPGDRGMTQDTRLPVLRGQAGLRSEPDPIDTSQPTWSHSADADANVLEFIEGPQTFLPSKSRSTREKKEKQAQNWQRIVIPRLVQPFMEYLKKTDNLRLATPAIRHQRCSCPGVHDITISIVRFDKIEEVQVPYCHNCKSVATTLIQSGLFPCAPFRPSLAVDVHVLDFVTRLFLRISPNHTAWCNALEDFLNSQGYRLHGSDPFRRRFANALMWFNTLQNSVNADVNSFLEDVREATVFGGRETHGGGESGVQHGSAGTSEESMPPPNERADGPESTQYGEQSDEDDRKTKRKRDEVHETSNGSLAGPANDHRTHRPQVQGETGTSKRDRASEYLRSRCPLCFGMSTSPDTHDPNKPTVLVCVDACFTQKHTDQHGKDPRRIHPDTMFVSPDKVKAMEEEVGRRRNTRNSKRPRREENDGDDCLENGMKVPKSSLDGCEQSFNAANGTAKGTLKGYDETALAGMFCPHGGCLFVVTMSSVGEKQHYILTLLQTLFEHLPDYWIVGFLYDIACHVERSCRKWGFLEEYLDRIVWGVSVFHAYGHEWPCQLVYHPRKCAGFGLCDGETCERCWHALSRLIAYTRVAGYYVRLYTLDTQLHFNNQQALANAGNWLRQKLRQCRNRQIAAQEELDSSGQSIDVLRREWANQVRSQTKPLPTQKKQAAKSAVEETLRLRKAVEVLQERVSSLEDVVLSNQSASYQQAIAADDLVKAREQLRIAMHKSSKQEKSLGIPEQAQLKHLVNSTFLTKRMNAQAVKTRLRERLRARKFELDRLERSFRKQRSEQQLHTHTRDAVQRREPGILALATKYNKLCDEMSQLIQQRKAPRFAVAPAKIQRGSLFDLDVDEDIWQDIGLEDEPSTNPPLWLCNENVRKGIRAMLELDRCEEEMERLRVQRNALQEWFIEEWKLLNAANQYTDDQGLVFQLGRRKKHLLKLYVSWEWPLIELSDGVSREWGPSVEEIACARSEVLTDHVEEAELEVFDIGFEQEADSVLVERLDTFDVVDSFRGVIDEM
ncbi:hypothetical protein K435DRAFT_694536 [Dendrothele bispora CBS 962.96]|uniref:CxC1-like cysteine cluster associated with KDZ transposases domain-containing protein n=1 Tax=Dendrothele bispora (strain CBS 962.96) TaxID=1314807 RepID=A0A4S8KY94_DENBC|nr:hypothetical protein K435DRAFT_694536 [Dendrothele bispora CBS 962.96]